MGLLIYFSKDALRTINYEKIIPSSVLFYFGLIFLSCNSSNKSDQIINHDIFITTNPCIDPVADRSSDNIFNDTCFEMPDPFPLEIFDSEDFDIASPSYATNNKFQFLFRQGKTNGSSYWVLDYCSPTDSTNFTAEKVIDGFVPGYGCPRLGPNNWIVYTTEDFRLMLKNMEDNSEAHHIVEEYDCRSPFWLSSKSAFICKANTGNGSSKTLLIYPDSLIIEEIETPPAVLFAEYNGRIAAARGPFGAKKSWLFRCKL